MGLLSAALAKDVRNSYTPYRRQGITLFSHEARMEFHTEREEALYTTLKQVLQNHIITHRLSYQHTLAACIPVLGYILYIMLETWEEAPELIARTIDELHERVHTRVLRIVATLPAFEVYALHPDVSTQYQELGTALATLLTTSGLEYDLSVVSTWRAYLALVAAVLVMPLLAQSQLPEELEAYIASLRDDLLGLMHMWDEQRG